TAAFRPRLAPSGGFLLFVLNYSFLNADRCPQAFRFLPQSTGQSPAAHIKQLADLMLTPIEARVPRPPVPAAHHPVHKDIVRPCGPGGAVRARLKEDANSKRWSK
ncbi:hypothetical protein COY28_04770, partial [Candidatus Woesearchaeota archaeon CG_4_10_14_0_2_um_filter_57_5]